MKYAVLYSPSSVQRVLDFIRSVYVFPDVTPVIVKPVGAAAQIGVPEAHKYAYKRGKPLIILPELQDVKEVLKVGKAIYAGYHGAELSINEIKNVDDYAIVVSDRENEPSKKELAWIEIVKFKELPTGLPPAPLVTLILYLVSTTRDTI
ncbi:MAG: recombinase RecB [Thermoprotei archaeon]|nr:MAG: recombinase RecB [Thermoprotei archaeon]